MACSEKLCSHKGTHPILIFSQKGSPLLPSSLNPSKHILLISPENQLHWFAKNYQKLDLPKTTRFITKSCGASRIPNSGLLLPSPRATWQEEESRSSTSSTRGAPVPWLLGQPITAACTLPSSPGDGAQRLLSGSREDWAAVEQGGGRCQLTRLPPPRPSGDDLHALSNLFQIQAAPPPPLQAQWGKRTGVSPVLPREEPSPSSQQEAQGATSQTTGVTAAPHSVMKDLGQSGWARGQGIIITSEAAAAQPQSVPQLWPLAKEEKKR